MMKSLIRFACRLALSIAISACAISNAQTVVATKQVQLKTKSFLFKIPVEAHRGERWVVTKKDKNKVSLTFGPEDERREMMRSAGISKLPQYELDAKLFASVFVPEDQWRDARRSLASELQKQFTDLSLQECEKVIDGELWIGMLTVHAAEAVGNRIFQKESRESKDGKSEIWKVGAFSIATTVKGSATSYVFDDLTATPSRPVEPLNARMVRDLDTAVRLILTFTDGALSEIVRR